MNYVGGNAEMISKNYKSLPEFERSVYFFESEDRHQQIAHIQHENKWLVEPFELVKYEFYNDVAQAQRAPEGRVISCRTIFA